MIIEYRHSRIDASVTGKRHRDALRSVCIRLVSIQSQSLERLRHAFCQRNRLLGQNSSIRQHPAHRHVLRQRRDFLDMIVEYRHSRIDASVTGKGYRDALRSVCIRLVSIQSQSLECLRHTLCQRNRLLRQHSSIRQHPPHRHVLRQRRDFLDMIVEYRCCRIDASIPCKGHCDALRRIAFGLISIQRQSLERLRHTFCQGNRLLGQHGSIRQHPAHRHILRQRSNFLHVIIEYRRCRIDASVTGKRHRDAFRCVSFRFIPVKIQSLERLRHTFCQCDSLLGQHGSIRQHPAHRHILRQRSNFLHVIVEYWHSRIDASVTGKRHRDALGCICFRLISIQIQSLERLRHAFRQRHGLFRQDCPIRQHPASGHILGQWGRFWLRCGIGRNIQCIGIDRISVCVIRRQKNCLFPVHLLSGIHCHHIPDGRLKRIISMVRMTYRKHIRRRIIGNSCPEDLFT